MRTMIELEEEEILIKAPRLYRDQIKKYLLLYKARGDQGFVLLIGKAREVFLLCDGRKTVGEISFILCKHGLDKVEVLTILSALVNKKVLVPASKINKVVAQDKKYAARQALGIWLHITNACNLRCSYCYINKNNGGMPMSIAEKTILNAIDQCRKYNIPALFIKFAGGEPLTVWQNILRVIEFAREHSGRAGIKATFSLLSNGTLMREEVARYLAENRIAIAISLDGVESVNDKQRFYIDGRGSFSAVVRGIEILKQVNWKPSILITITDKNTGGLRELTNFLLRNSLNFRYSLIRDCNQMSTRNLFAASARYAEVLHRCFDDIEEWMLTKDWNFSVQFCDINLSRSVGRACGTGENFVAVDYNGNIALCQMMFNEPIGDINSNGIFEVMREQIVMPELRQKIVDEYSECNQCIWKNVCAGGCPVFTYKQFGKINTASPYCYAFRELIPRVVRLKGIKLIKEYEKKSEVMGYAKSAVSVTTA